MRLKGWDIWMEKNLAPCWGEQSAGGHIRRIRMTWVMDSWIQRWDVIWICKVKHNPTEDKRTGLGKRGNRKRREVGRIWKSICDCHNEDGDCAEITWVSGPLWRLMRTRGCQWRDSVLRKVQEGWQGRTSMLHRCVLDGKMRRKKANLVMCLLYDTDVFFILFYSFVVYILVSTDAILLWFIFFCQSY